MCFPIPSVSLSSIFLWPSRTLIVKLPGKTTKSVCLRKAKGNSPVGFHSTRQQPRQLHNLGGEKIPDGSIFLNNRKLFQSEMLFIEQTLKKNPQKPSLSTPLLNVLQRKVQLRIVDTCLNTGLETPCLVFEIYLFTCFNKNAS